MWKNGKKWVYSITYDEGVEKLLDYTVPLHQKYGIPGHLSIVASQIGVKRNVPGSTFNGWQILSKEQILSLKKQGWGVSCHSMTHAHIDDKNIKHELYDSRVLMEKTLGFPVKTFCLPGDNSHFPIVHQHCLDAGYNSNLTIYDDINTKDTDLLRLCRCPIHTEYPPPFYSKFDSYKRLHQAIDAGGWVIDYCHCPLPDKPSHPAKDCTTEELEMRFKTVLKVGGNNVWLAEPNEVIKYILNEENQMHSLKALEFRY